MFCSHAAATLSSDPSAKDLLGTVKKVNRLGKAVEDLVAWSGKKLVSHSPNQVDNSLSHCAPSCRSEGVPSTGGSETQLCNQSTGKI